MTLRGLRLRFLCAASLALACAAAQAQATPEVTEESLIPTRAEQTAQHARTLAVGIERTLAALPGVARARVLIALAAAPAFANELTEKPRASVLIVPAQPNARLDKTAIAKLVAYAVPALEPERVNVAVYAALPNRSDPSLSQVGPFSVSHQSAPLLRATLASMLALHGLLAWTLMRMVARRRRERSLAADGGR